MDIMNRVETNSYKVMYSGVLKKKLSGAVVDKVQLKIAGAVLQ